MLLFMIIFVRLSPPHSCKGKSLCHISRCPLPEGSIFGLENGYLTYQTTLVSAKFSFDFKFLVTLQRHIQVNFLKASVSHQCTHAFEAFKNQLASLMGAVKEVYHSWRGPRGNKIDLPCMVLHGSQLQPLTSPGSVGG